MDLKQWCVRSVLACTLSITGVASAADLSVNGKIQSGGACSLTLGNGGVIDVGTISRKDFKDDLMYHDVPGHELSLHIHCQTPTKVALRALDNRGGEDAYAFSLGVSGGKEIGYYTFFPWDRIGDGADLVQLVDQGIGVGWKSTGDISSAYGIYPTDLSSWAEPGQSLPQAFQNISSRLGFTIVINVENLDLGQEIAIDGSATMELVYL